MTNTLGGPLGVHNLPVEIASGRFLDNASRYLLGRIGQFSVLCSAIASLCQPGRILSTFLSQVYSPYGTDE